MPQQRHVTIKNDQLALEISESLAGRQYRVPGTQLRLLKHKLHFRQGRLDRLRPRADNHDAARNAGTLQLVQKMPQHRLAADEVKDLGQCGFHPRTLARGQNYGACFAHFSMSRFGGQTCCSGRNLP